jgi:hypothetical protein
MALDVRINYVLLLGVVNINIYKVNRWEENMVIRFHGKGAWGILGKA